MQGAPRAGSAHGVAEVWGGALQAGGHGRRRTIWPGNDFIFSPNMSEAMVPSDARRHLTQVPMSFVNVSRHSKTTGGPYCNTVEI